MAKSGHMAAAFIAAWIVPSLNNAAGATDAGSPIPAPCIVDSTAALLACDARRLAQAWIAGSDEPGQISISRWSPQSRSHVAYAGYDCTVDGMRPWSVTSLDGDEIKFEVRPGDRLLNTETGYRDPATAERAELVFSSARWANGIAVNIAYEFLVPSGFDFDAPWTTVGQMHANLNVSPPVELAFRSGSGLNAMFLLVRTGDSSNVSEKEIPVSLGPIERDKWHKVRLEARMGPRGFLRVWINQTEVFRAEGQIGFADQTSWYWRMGLYRKASRETYKMHYRAFRMTRISG